MVSRDDQQRGWVCSARCVGVVLNDILLQKNQKMRKKAILILWPILISELKELGAKCQHLRHPMKNEYEVT